MINIIIADDHAIVRKGLDLFLKFEDEVRLIAEAADGDELLQVLSRMTADVVLLDIDMPKMNGITVLRTMQEEFPNIKVVILSMHREEIYGPTVRKLGALGYVTKDADPKEVVRAVKEVHAGRLFFREELYTVRTPLREKQRKIKLSNRESEVLKLLSIGKSNKDISEELGISDKTVSTYKQRLLNKLQARNVVDLINFAKMYQFV
ncbi:response regulator [bacterium]|nr:response regulator [bacterium]